jgi:hypothetical protein
MTFSSSVINLLIKGLDCVIAGPYSSEKQIQAKITSYNKTHQTEVKIIQKRLLLVNPEILETQRVWRVELSEVRETTKELKKRGRPKL